jgi:hypothetical protein
MRAMHRSIIGAKSHSEIDINPENAMRLKTASKPHKVSFLFVSDIFPQLWIVIAVSGQTTFTEIL